MLQAIKYSLPIASLAFFVMLAAPSSPVNAVVIYSNDFEANTAGFNVTDREIFPSSTTSSSTYLGRRGGGFTAVLTLGGLTVGATYDLAFDLYIGGTWDGSLSFGPDFFSLTSNSEGALVNATFRNGFPIGTEDAGQTYSDATPLGDGGLFRSRSGADVELGEPIYYLGHGAGNPLLSFIADSTSELLTFSSSPAQLFDGDEFFALDNVVVSTADITGGDQVPEPSALALFGVGFVGLGAIRRRRKLT